MIWFSNGDLNRSRVTDSHGLPGKGVDINLVGKAVNIKPVTSVLFLLKKCVLLGKVSGRNCPDASHINSLLQFLVTSTYTAVHSVIILGDNPFPTVPTHPGKSCNSRKEFSRPGKSWKMTVVMESHGIPPIGDGIFNRRTIILGV